MVTLCRCRRAGAASSSTNLSRAAPGSRPNNREQEVQNDTPPTADLGLQDQQSTGARCMWSGADRPAESRTPIRSPRVSPSVPRAPAAEVAPGVGPCRSAIAFFSGGVLDEHPPPRGIGTGGACSASSEAFHRKHVAWAPACRNRDACANRAVVRTLVDGQVESGAGYRWAMSCLTHKRVVSPGSRPTFTWLTTVARSGAMRRVPLVVLLRCIDLTVLHASGGQASPTSPPIRRSEPDPTATAPGSSRWRDGGGGGQRRLPRRRAVLAGYA